MNINIKKANKILYILTGVLIAIMYLRAGGDAYSLQYLLGHSDMTVTRMYVSIAAVDIGELYKSPLDRL